MGNSFYDPTVVVSDQTLERANLTRSEYEWIYENEMKQQEAASASEIADETEMDLAEDDLPGENSTNTAKLSLYER